MIARAAVALLMTGVAAAFLHAQDVRADPQVGPPERPVLVQVIVVHATQKAGKIDPGCQYLKRKLGLMNFRSLRLIQDQRYKLRMGEQARLRLPEGHWVQFQPISVLDQELHMQVRMPGVDTRMRMATGRGVILGGVKHEDGVLVVHLKPSFRIPRPPSPAAKKKREELRQLRLLREAAAEAAGP